MKILLKITALLLLVIILFQLVDWSFLVKTYDQLEEASRSAYFNAPFWLKICIWFAYIALPIAFIIQFILWIKRYQDGERW